jgi:hypothetical protein
MNAYLTLIHAYDSLARHSHQWPAKARMCAMVDLWRCAEKVKKEETMPGTPWKLDTQEKLRDAGYSFEEAGTCADPNCKSTVYWFITPKQKWMPFELIAPADPLAGTAEMRYQPHFATCPGARKFSRKSKDKIERRSA